MLEINHTFNALMDTQGIIDAIEVAALEQIDVPKGKRLEIVVTATRKPKPGFAANITFADLVENPVITDNVKTNIEAVPQEEEDLTEVADEEVDLPAETKPFDSDSDPDDEDDMFG